MVAAVESSDTQAQTVPTSALSKGRLGGAGGGGGGDRRALDPKGARAARAAAVGVLLARFGEEELAGLREGRKRGVVAVPEEHGQQIVRDGVQVAEQGC